MFEFSIRRRILQMIFIGFFLFVFLFVRSSPLIKGKEGKSGRDMAFEICGTMTVENMPKTQCFRGELASGLTQNAWNDVSVNVLHATTLFVFSEKPSNVGGFTKVKFLMVRGVSL